MRGSRGGDVRAARAIQATLYASSSPTQSLPILIIDDNRSVVDSLKMLLDLNGNTTHTAYDGLEGLEVAERVRPAIILLDIGLPKLTVGNVAGAFGSSRGAARSWCSP